MSHDEGGHNPLGSLIVDLRPTDVLLGRGSGPNDHEGNKRFRRMVADRKTEYMATNHRLTKAKIAQEIVDGVYQVNGRFLRKLEGDEAVQYGIPDGVDAYVIATEATIMEKAKQALRQNATKFKESGSLSPITLTKSPIMMNGTFDARVIPTKFHNPNILGSNSNSNKIDPLPFDDFEPIPIASSTQQQAQAQGQFNMAPPADLPQGWAHQRNMAAASNVGSQLLDIHALEQQQRLLKAVQLNQQLQQQQQQQSSIQHQRPQQLQQQQQQQEILSALSRQQQLQPSAAPEHVRSSLDSNLISHMSNLPQTQPDYHRHSITEGTSRYMGRRSDESLTDIPVDDFSGGNMVPNNRTKSITIGELRTVDARRKYMQNTQNQSDDQMMSGLIDSFTHMKSTDKIEMEGHQSRGGKRNAALVRGGGAGNASALDDKHKMFASTDTMGTIENLGALAGEDPDMMSMGMSMNSSTFSFFGASGLGNREKGFLDTTNCAATSGSSLSGGSGHDQDQSFTMLNTPSLLGPQQQQQQQQQYTRGMAGSSQNNGNGEYSPREKQNTRAGGRLLGESIEEGIEFSGHGSESDDFNFYPPTMTGNKLGPGGEANLRNSKLHAADHISEHDISIGSIGASTFLKSFAVAGHDFDDDQQAKRSHD